MKVSGLLNIEVMYPKSRVDALVSAVERARAFIAAQATSSPELIAAELKNIDEALATIRSNER
jgi:predicted transcriptional regulator